MKIFSPGKRGIVFRRMLSIHLLLCICSILLLGSLLVNQLLRVTDKIDSVREADIAANCASQANILADYSRGAITQIENSEWMYYDLFIRHILTGERLPLNARKEIPVLLSVLVQQRTDVESISFWFYRKPDTLFTGAGIYEDVATLRELFPEKLCFRTFPLGDSAPGFSAITHEGKTYLAYRAPFRDNRDTSYKGEVCVLFKPEKLTRTFLAASEQLASGLSIADASGKTLWSCALLETGESVSSFEIASGDYRYILQFPASTHRMAARQIAPMIVWGILAVLGVGMLLSFVFTRVVYKLFGEMYLAFVGQPQASDNEIERLSETMTSISRSRAQALSAQQLLMPFGRLSILRNLLTGAPFQYSEDAMHACGLEFPHPLFGVMLFKAPPGSAADAIADESRAACDRACSDDLRAYFLLDDGRGVCLINAESERALTGAANAIAGSLRELISHFGMGETQLQLREVYHATDQALLALNYGILNGRANGIVRYEDVGAQTSFSYYFPLSDQARLASVLAGGDSEGAKRIVSYVIAMNARGGRGSLRTLSMLAGDLFSTLLRCAIGMGVDLDPGEATVESFADLENRAHAFIDALTARVPDSREPESSGVEAEILKFIDDSLFDPLLSLDYVAQRFGKSSAYISSTFKRLRGMNYVDYINRRRIERAEALLAGGGMSVGDVCEAVGYASATTFRRNFAKYTGKSPANCMH